MTVLTFSSEMQWAEKGVTQLGAIKLQYFATGGPVR